MKLRFYLDPEAGVPHIYGHGVTEAEIEEVLGKPGEDRAGHDQMTQKSFPPGWDEARVRGVLSHYESQSEEEAVAEDEALAESTADTVMPYPSRLFPPFGNSSRNTNAKRAVADADLHATAGNSLHSR